MGRRHQPGVTVLGERRGPSRIAPEEPDGAMLSQAIGDLPPLRSADRLGCRGPFVVCVRGSGSIELRGDVEVDRRFRTIDLRLGGRQPLERHLPVVGPEHPRGEAPLHHRPVRIVGIDGDAPPMVDADDVTAVRQPSVACASRSPGPEAAKATWFTKLGRPSPVDNAASKSGRPSSWRSQIASISPLPVS